METNFGPILKDWRGRRRMSQLELGLAADVSARHVAFLETGRSKPSRSMVIQLSDALAVPRSERNSLLNAAGFTSIYKQRDLDEKEMTHVRAAVDWTLMRHDPFPAIAVDKHWHLVRMNNTASALFGAIGVAVGDSMLQTFIETPAVRDAIENWDEVARFMVVRLRTESAHLGGDAVLDEAANKLAEETGEGPAGTNSALPAVISTRYRAGDMTLALFSTIAQFGSAEDIALADLRLEMMFPTDDATRNLLIGNFGNDADKRAAGLA